MDELPSYPFIYLGDMARLPYGTKSTEVVTSYALKAAGELVKRGIEILVVGCNTVSACALPVLRAAFPNVPIIDVITPTVAYACQQPHNSRFLLMATETTIRSQIYQTLIGQGLPGSFVDVVAPNLLVSLAEEGWHDEEIVHLVLKRYLTEAQVQQPPDAVILGCTHFPALKQAIASFWSQGVELIDSTQPTAREVKRALGGETSSLIHLNTSSSESKEGLKGQVQYYVTDSPERFSRVAYHFLHKSLPLGEVGLVSL